jgi:hypothetical protein
MEEKVRDLEVDWGNLPQFNHMAIEENHMYWYKHVCSQIPGVSYEMRGEITNFGRIDWSYAANFCPRCGLKLPQWLSHAHEAHHTASTKQFWNDT